MSTDERRRPVPRYQEVKDHITERIVDGTWPTGGRIASEHQLVQRFAVSRMTVNRALRELTAEGVLTRVRGVGTFVAARRPQAALLEIKSIAREIGERGGSHTCIIHLLQEEKARPALANGLGIGPGDPVFHSVIVHKENGVPIQLADRYVTPAFAPEFLAQDFTTMTPSDYLLSLAPISEVEHVIEAQIPEAWIGDLLAIKAAEPCLVLRRRTWVEGEVVTSSFFYYPGSRYTIGGRFKPARQRCLNIT